MDWIIYARSGWWSLITLRDDTRIHFEKIGPLLVTYQCVVEVECCGGLLGVDTHHTVEMFVVCVSTLVGDALLFQSLESCAHAIGSVVISLLGRWDKEDGRCFCSEVLFCSHRVVE
jgi:hypothetical protein